MFVQYILDTQCEKNRAALSITSLLNVLNWNANKLRYIKSILTKITYKIGRNYVFWSIDPVYDALAFS